MENQFGRLKVWAGNLGVFTKGPASADYRLREDSIIKDLVIKLLCRLTIKLDQFSDRPSMNTRSSSLEDQDRLSDGSSSSLGLSSDTDTDSENGVDQDIDSLQKSNNRQMDLNDVNVIITRLYKITSIINKPVPAREHDKVQDWFASEGSQLEHQLSELRSFTDWLIKNKYPRLKHCTF